MIGAIKRRWKSKKAKVLHKGNDLSSSSDSCPTSRGFVDGPEDFEKMIKPPSPRQVHPVLEKSDLKFGQLHNIHHLLQQNNGNTGSHTYALQQPPTGKKKSSTLPATDDGGGIGDNKCGSSGSQSQDGCHFIRVNSGRIELVSKDSWKTHSSSSATAADQSGNYLPHSNTSATERFLSRHHLKNDIRHSWCGSAVRPQHKICDAQQQQSKRLSEDQPPQYSSGGGFRTGLGSNNNNNRIYPQEELTAPTALAAATSEAQRHHYHLVQSDVDGENTMILTTTTTTSSTTATAATLPAYNSISQSMATDDLSCSPSNGKGLLSPLRERLAAIEQLTTSLQSWQTTEKTEYEKCVSDLANQVSRAVALQQLMKSEVEKLQQRVVDLENHNKAMATMIIPTLMKLHDSTVSIKDGPPLKSIEPAPNPDEGEGKTTRTTSSCETQQSESQRNLPKSKEIKRSLSPSPADNNDHASGGCINNITANSSSSSSCTNKSPSHFIAVVSTSSSPSCSAAYYSSKNTSCPMKTIGYEQSTSTLSSENSTAATSIPTRTASSDMQTTTMSPSMHVPNAVMSASTPVSSLKSPVKAPRTSRTAATTQIPRVNGSSSGNICGSSSSLSRNNSCNNHYNNQMTGSCNSHPVAGAISLIETELASPSTSLKQHRDEPPNQSQPNQNNPLITSLESSITSSTSSTGPINLEMSNCSQNQFSNNNNSSRSAPRSSCRSNNSNSQSSTSRTSLSAIPRMSSPARTATVTKIPCGQQQSNNSCPTPKPTRRVSDRSLSPHGSKLPVRKASFAASSSATPTTNKPTTTNTSPHSGNSRHPAASSKSLPANSNMGTVFQNMSKSGPQGNKHSKSTFGFGMRKNSANSNSKNGTSNRAGNTNSVCSSAQISNLPENGSGSNSAATSTISPAILTSSVKPIKPGSTTSSSVAAAIVPTAIGITKASGTGKDEGYSTMSSEALAEQEHHHLQHSLEKSQSQRGRPALSRNSTFSVKRGGSGRTIKVANTIPSSSTNDNKMIIGSGSCTNTVVAPTVESPDLTYRKGIHKSNTFNTFREIPSSSNRACDADDDDEDGKDAVCGIGSESRRRMHSSKSSYVPISASQYARNSHDIMTNGDYRSLLPRNSQASQSSGQCTSFPQSSSSASSSPSKGKVESESGPSSCSTPKTKRSAKSCYRKDRITATTRMMDGNIVRIVRGSPYSVRIYGDDSGDDMDDDEDPSSSTILWEDSDDSDILFLPLEVSASSAASSRSTLVPPPQSSGESRSYYSSWGTGSSSMGASTNTYCSTLEKGSNSSVNNSTVGDEGGVGCSSDNTFSRKAYPLRRTKGEVTVDILVGNIKGGGHASLCDDANYQGKTCSSNNDLAANTGDGNLKGINDEIDELGHLQLVNNHEHDDNQTTTDEMEERALIEKWMQLEEVRNEQVQGGEQWAWDWDGVERTYTRVLRNAANALKRVPVEFQDDDDDLDVDLILEESALQPPPPEEEQGPKSFEERNNAMNESDTRHQFDSSTWTKSKSRVSNKAAGSNKESSKTDGTALVGRQGNNSPSKSPVVVASPEKVRRGDEHQIPLVLEGERNIENDAGPLIKRVRDGDEQSCCDEVSRGADEDGDGVSKKSHNGIINPDENGMVVTSSVLSGDNMGDADGEEEEDDPPPVIEFTPEFYQLANYGSNLSFSDNESGNVALQNNSSGIASITTNATSQSPSKVIGSTTGESNNKSNIGCGSNSTTRQTVSPKKKKLTRKAHNSTAATETPLHVTQQPKTPTDDKISQTDFSCSSLENMSSVSSSELSAECRNCLEIIKKLVGQADTDAEGDEEIGCNNSGDSSRVDQQTGCRREKKQQRPHRKKGESKSVDAGSYATTWISVPNGIPTAEVDRILEILSSSESEGVLSPSK